MQHLQNSIAELRAIANRMNEAVTSKSINLFRPDAASKRFIIKVRYSDSGGNNLTHSWGDTALQTEASLELLTGVIFDKFFVAFISAPINVIKAMNILSLRNIENVV